MSKHGYDPLAGNIALVEIPWSDDEIAELTKKGLLTNDWKPPTPLNESVKDGVKQNEMVTHT